MSEFCDAIFSELNDYLKDSRSDYLCYEAIKGKRFEPEIALVRAINNLYNSNGDEYISVYELSQNLDLKCHEKNGSIDFTKNEIIKQEYENLNQIGFYFLTNIDESGNMKINMNMNTKEINSEIVNETLVGKNSETGVENSEMVSSSLVELKKATQHDVYKVRPFHRPLIVADVPLYDQEIYEWDHLVLVSYSNSNSSSSSSNSNNSSFVGIVCCRCCLLS
jgi:hypothetical protein